MNKQELLENYTMEQLADIVIEMQDKKDCENKSYKIPFAKMCGEELEKFLSESPLKKSMDNLFEDIKKQKDDAIAKAFTEQIGKLLRDNGVIAHYITNEAIYETEENPVTLRYGVVFDSLDFSEHDKKFTDEIRELKKKLDRKQTSINQIDDILNELFGVTHDVTSKPDEFKEILKEKIENSKTITDFIPTEPIKVADMLISAEGECEPLELGNDVYKDTYKIFEASELRQIAEHLLVYCNANESEEKK